jgi:hypothetical protein
MLLFKQHKAYYRRSVTWLDLMGCNTSLTSKRSNAPARWGSHLPLCFVIGFLHMPQLHGANQWLTNQGESEPHCKDSKNDGYIILLHHISFSTFSTGWAKGKWLNRIFESFGWLWRWAFQRSELSLCTQRNTSHRNRMSTSKSLLFLTSAPKWCLEKPLFLLRLINYMRAKSSYLSPNAKQVTCMQRGPAQATKIPMPRLACVFWPSLPLFGWQLIGLISNFPLL